MKSTTIHHSNIKLLCVLLITPIAFAFGGVSGTNSQNTTYTGTNRHTGTEDYTGATISHFPIAALPIDTDAALSGSNSKVPSDGAVKHYIENLDLLSAGDLMNFDGGLIVSDGSGIIQPFAVVTGSGYVSTSELDTPNINQGTSQDLYINDSLVLIRSTGDILANTFYSQSGYCDVAELDANVIFTHGSDHLEIFPPVNFNDDIRVQNGHSLLGFADEGMSQTFNLDAASGSVTLYNGASFNMYFDYGGTSVVFSVNGANGAIAGNRNTFDDGNGNATIASNISARTLDLYNDTVNPTLSTDPGCGGLFWDISYTLGVTTQLQDHWYVGPTSPTTFQIGGRWGYTPGAQIAFDNDGSFYQPNGLWALNNGGDGAGFLASGNIAWDASGDFTSSSGGHFNNAVDAPLFAGPVATTNDQAPASGDAGSAGEMIFTDTYTYRCFAPGDWRRVAVSYVTY